MGYRGIPGLVAAFLCLLYLQVGSANEPPFGTPARCEEAPLWSLRGRYPMLESRGQVTVVALLQASWGFCLTQAANLEAMRRQYETQYNITDIKFIVVNAGDLVSRLNYYRLYWLGNYDLYQDYSSQVDPEDNVWNLLNGSKDDFLIYDRCGQLTYHIPLPYSALRYPFVQIAIESTYIGTHPCNCSADHEETTTALPSTVQTEPTTTTAATASAEPNALWQEEELAACRERQQQQRLQAEEQGGEVRRSWCWCWSGEVRLISWRPLAGVSSQLSMVRGSAGWCWPSLDGAAAAADAAAAVPSNSRSTTPATSTQAWQPWDGATAAPWRRAEGQIWDQQPSTSWQPWDTTTSSSPWHQGQAWGETPSSSWQSRETTTPTATSRNVNSRQRRHVRQNQSWPGDCSTWQWS